MGCKSFVPFQLKVPKEHWFGPVLIAWWGWPVAGYGEEFLMRKELLDLLKSMRQGFWAVRRGVKPRYGHFTVRKTVWPWK